MLMRKLLSLFVSVFLLTTSCVESQNESPTTALESNAFAATTAAVQWYRYDKGIELAKTKKKFTFVKFHVDWCGYCRKMDEAVFPEPKIKALLDKHFVSIRVNGESKQEVLYKGQKVTEAKLAALHRVQGYPTLMFLDPKSKLIGMIPGFLDKDEFVLVLEYISSQSYQKMDFQTYQKQKGT